MMKYHDRNSCISDRGQSNTFSSKIYDTNMPTLLCHALTSKTDKLIFLNAQEISLTKKKPLAENAYLKRRDWYGFQFRD